MGSVHTPRGVTLIEILIAMAVGTMLLSAVVSNFIDQHEAYLIRDQVVMMQQNARGGMDFMIRELAMASYDPTETAGAGIVAASANTIQATMDLNNDGDTDDTNEDVTYVLYDGGGDGDLDLGRDTGGGNQLLAVNIQSLTLVYTLDNGTTTSTPADPSQIRAIDVALTARTAQPDQQYPTNNGYRTMTLTTTVWVRNLGL